MSGHIITAQALQSRSAGELLALIVQNGGPYLKLSDVWQVLGYPTLEAARKAASRKQLPIQPVDLPQRRGRFVRAIDLADWLYQSTRKDTTPQDTGNFPPRDQE